MNISRIFASMLSGRRLFRRKRQPVRKVQRRTTLNLEALESRWAPATFTVLDSFSGASTSDSTVNSAGTADLNAAGIFVNTNRPTDSGVDTALASGPTQGSADATQLADTRDVTLNYTAAAAGEAGEVRAQTAVGALSYASGSSNSAEMILDYGDLSTLVGAPVILIDSEICVVFASVEAGAEDSFPVTLELNGDFVGTVDVFDSAGLSTACFDATAFVGEQITSMVFTFSGNLATDFDIDRIEASFATIDASIELNPPEDTNEVNDDHEVCATVLQDDDGDGVFTPAPDGTEVLFVITNNGTDAALDDTADENGDGDFANDEIVTTVGGEACITFTSTTAGTVTTNASATFDIGGVSVTRDTDPTTVDVSGPAGEDENGPATKVFVDAQIDLDPLLDTNLVTESHTVTAIVQQDAGDGAGFVAAPDGTEVLFEITNAGTDAQLDGTADENGNGDFFDDEIVATVGGEAAITFVSSTAGTVNIHASTTFDVGGLTLTRETDGIGLNSGDAQKDYEAPEEEGRMTGGGSIIVDGLRITHGFQLHCAQPPEEINNRLEINWGKPNNHFHLLTLTSVVCSDNPIIQAPPDAPIDTMVGEGDGRFSGTYLGVKYRNVAATVTFTFTDGGPLKGEPGIFDTASYVITVLDGNKDGIADDPVVVLDTSGSHLLTFGNHQAHNEIPNLTTAAATIQTQIDQTLAQLDSQTLSASKIQSLTSKLLTQLDQLEAALLT